METIKFLRSREKFLFLLSISLESETLVNAWWELPDVSSNHSLKTFPSVCPLNVQYWQQQYWRQKRGDIIMSALFTSSQCRTNPSPVSESVLMFQWSKYTNTQSVPVEQIHSLPSAVSTSPTPVSAAAQCVQACRPFYSWGWSRASWIKSESFEIETFCCSYLFV